MVPTFPAEAYALARLARWEWQLGSDTLLLSAEMLALFGQPQDPASPSREQLLQFVHPEDRHKARRHFWPLLESAIDSRCEFRLIGTGEPRFVRGVTRVYRDAEGQEAYVVGICQDITEEKEQLWSAQKEAQDRFDASKLVTLLMLLRGLGHEINNPNGLILLGTHLLRDAWTAVEPILEEHHQNHGNFAVAGLPYDQMRLEIPRVADDVILSAERIRQLVADLRQYTRLISAEEWTVLSFNNVVSLACNGVKKSPREGATVAIEVVLDAEVPPVYANADRLLELITHLLSNAVEASTGAARHIGVRTWANVLDKTVHLEVEDHGQGIAQEDLDHITDPFFTTKRAQGHSGLGLAIASALAREFNARLVFTSTVGEGTRATLILPAHEHLPMET